MVGRGLTGTVNEERCHEMSRGLREFVGGTRESKLLEATAQGVRMEPEDGGRALRPFNDPACPLEDALDVAPLDLR